MFVTYYHYYFLFSLFTWKIKWMCDYILITSFYLSIVKCRINLQFFFLVFISKTRIVFHCIYINAAGIYRVRWNLFYAQIYVRKSFIHLNLTCVYLCNYMLPTCAILQTNNVIRFPCANNNKTWWKMASWAVVRVDSAH